jgi:DNA-directed RNA polymerase subunit RPC12/RpoP
MPNVLRHWKCRNCGRANETTVGLDGTAKCEHCANRMSIQPSRIRNGVLLPASYPTRHDSPRNGALIGRLGE